MQGPIAVKQQVSDVQLSRGERRLVWKTLPDHSSSVALAALDENQAALDGTAPSVNLQSARHFTPEGRSGWDNAGEGDDPVRCDASKEVDASRLAIGFAHVLRGVYATYSRVDFELGSDPDRLVLADSRAYICEKGRIA